MRKFLHIALNGSQVAAVASDGTAWVFDAPEWKQLPDLPQPEKSPKTSDKGTTGYTTEFEQFWAVYPRKDSKKLAAQAFAKCKADRPPIKELIATIERHKQRPEWLKEGGKYIPMPSTWLNGGRWEDVLEREKPKQNFTEWKD